MNSDIALSLKTNRKIYYREDFFRFYNCSEQIPDYLKDFQYLYNNFTQDNWCKRPIPKFEDINEVKGKLSYPINKIKGRQRTLSNQSGENTVDSENLKQRNTNPNTKFSRSGNSVSETQFSEDVKWTSNNTFINPNDFVENAQWQKVESKSNRPPHSSKSYAQNIQLTENHWKKWSKDTNQNMEKTRVQNDSYNRSDRINNWSRKTDDNRHRNTKTYGMHNLNKPSDQTEDIWQDDWDTEMKSEIAKEEDDLILDSYQFPKSTILSITPTTEPDQIMGLKNSIFEPVPDPIISFDLWYYRDLSDIERGPFSSENMANWLATGYFNPSTFVRRSCDERFLLLAEYRALYGRIPFTGGPTIPPIYINTPIEIDINQLLIGVDSSLIRQVISCASCLSTITQSPLQQNNIKRLEENIKINQNSPEMLALLEEKRLIEKTRAELERERERMVQEQVQWRERIEAELKAKMEEIKLSLASPIPNTESHPILVSQPNLPVMNEPVQRCYEQVIADTVQEPVTPSSVNTDDENYRKNTAVVPESITEVTSTMVEQLMCMPEPTNHWFVAKDLKNQKKATRRSRIKDKESSNKAAEETSTSVVNPVQTKIIEQPTDSRLAFISKETMISMVNNDTRAGDTMKGRPIRFELDNRKATDPSVSWIAPGTTQGRSIVDIQAEELTKNRLSSESQKTATEHTEKLTADQVKNGDRHPDKQPISIWGAVKKTPNPNPQHLGELSILKIQAEELKKEKISSRKQQLEEKELAHERRTVNQKLNTEQDRRIDRKEILMEIEQNQQRQIPKLEPTTPWTAMSSITSAGYALPINTTQVTSSSSSTVITKSLKEIQAEEAIQEKREKQLQSIARASEIESNKVTSFKESLLKTTVKPVPAAAKLPVIPSGKSIWDMSLTSSNAESPISTGRATLSETVVKAINTEPVAKKAQPDRKSSDIDLDHLTSWCLKKLARFSDKFDLHTVIELLQQVPNEEVMELALQLIDDSKFTSSFVLEFIHKRQELSDRNGCGDAAGDSWQTVKKSLVISPSTAVSPNAVVTQASKNTGNKGLKSKQKKKLVVIDAKFR